MYRYKCMEANCIDYLVRRVIMKEKLCFILGALGAWIAGLFGGWNSAMTTLLLFMVADYLTGLIVAAVFQRSPKSVRGRSRVGSGNAPPLHAHSHASRGSCCSTSRSPPWTRPPATASACCFAGSSGSTASPRSTSRTRETRRDGWRISST